MTPEDREYFENLLIKANQSGKQETSGLVAHITKRMDSMDFKFDEYVKGDLKWKEEARPVIEMGKNIAGFRTVTKILFGIAAAVGSVIGGIAWIEHLIKSNSFIEHAVATIKNIIA